MSFRDSLKLLLIVCFVSRAQLLHGDETTTQEIKQDEAAAHTVILKTFDPDPSMKVRTKSLLIREIPRQALLIAARNELGLPTRDFTLREPEPENIAKNRPVEMVSGLLHGRKLQLTIYPRDPNEFVPLFEETFRLNRDAEIDSLTARCEDFSRTKFVDVLRAAGFPSRGEKQSTQSKLPKTIEEQISHLSFFSQYNVLRKVHQLQATAGESLACQQVLARAYANLGSLTETHWSPSEKAFKARALLYAERLVTASGKSPSAYWHRAYVKALVGMHSSATADVMKAESKQFLDRKNAAGVRPPWADVLTAYCRVDYAALVRLSEEGAYQGLARYFLMLEAESTPYNARTTRIAASVLEIIPDCFRAIDVIAKLNALSTTRAASIWGPQYLGKHAYERAMQADGLPVEIKQKIETYQAASRTDPQSVVPLRSLIDCLIKAGSPERDQREPSLAVLGRLIEETAFVQTYRSLHFRRRLLAENADSELARLQPLVSPHRYAAALEVFGSDLSKAAPKLETFRKSLDATELQTRYDGLFAVLGGMNSGSWAIAVSHQDSIFRDLTLATQYNKPTSSVNGPAYARLLSKISPEMPVAVAGRLLLNEETPIVDLTDVKKKYSASPIVLSALAQCFLSLDRPDEALHCLKQLVAVAPEEAAFRQLAAFHKTRGNTALWLQTLQKALDVPAIGLEHATIRVEIARYYMDKKHWTLAKPFAVAAAQSGAAWALLAAAECLRELEEWDAAEVYIRTTSLRYRGHEMDWFIWCHDTGKGEVEAARQLAGKYVESLGDSPPLQQVPLVYCYYLLTDKPKAAYALLKSIDRSALPRWLALHAALFAHEVGDVSERKSFLQSAINGPLNEPVSRSENGRPIVSKDRAMALMLQDLFNTKQSRADLTAIDKLIASGRNGEPTRLQYYVALLLELEGREKESLQYLQACATSPFSHINRTLSRYALRKAKVAIGKTREHEVIDSRDKR